MNKVVTETRGDIFIVTINRPEVMNALDPETHQAMSDAFDDFEQNPSLRVAIVTGASNKAFCAGGDIKTMATAVTKEDYAVPASGYGGITRRRWKKPLIAAINGMAFGGGFEMVMAAHLAVASEKAVFGLPEPLIGNAAVAGGMHRLPRHIPHKQAMEILLTAKTLTAQQALDFGLVNEIVSDDNVLERAIDVALQICRCAPLAIEATLQTATQTAQFNDIYDAMDAQEAGFFTAIDTMLHSEDTQEGLKAFIDKRPPQWKGK
jgi:crotonobetainyl-CoA hydratase